MRKILNAIWREYVYGGHVLALGAVSIVFTSSILLGIKITWDFLLIVYLGVYLVYLYNRYYEIEKDSLTNLQSVNYFKKYAKFSPLIIILCVFIIFLIQIYLKKNLTICISAVMLFLGLSYSIYFKKLTKKILAFKSLFVPLMWASLVLFLFIYYQKTPNFSFLIISIFIFLRLLIGTSFADIKDIESDKEDGLKTFPIIFGKDKVFIFLNVLNILAIFPILLGVYLKLLPNLALCLLLTSAFKYYCIIKTKKRGANIADITRKFDYQENVLWSIYLLIDFLIVKLL
jgi:4-hydroxybenzoate polyprenyltransferase